jgi:hypothetical protein
MTMQLPNALCRLTPELSRPATGRLNSGVRRSGMPVAHEPDGRFRKLKR